MEIYKNSNGDDCVTWKDDQGTHSMLKSTYDEQQAHLTESLPTSNP